MGVPKPVQHAIMPSASIARANFCVTPCGARVSPSHLANTSESSGARRCRAIGGVPVARPDVPSSAEPVRARAQVSFQPRGGTTNVTVP
jgi:hypothetical protein